MSSFICTPKHFNSVEKQLQYLFIGSDPHRYSYACAEAFNTRKAGVDQIYSSVSEFIDTLRELNNVCYHLQYKHHYEGTLDKEIATMQDEFKADKSTGDIQNIPALYKALSCIRYQIETDHLTELRALTEDETNALNMLTRLINDLAAYFITECANYEAAPWSID